MKKLLLALMLAPLVVSAANTDDILSANTQLKSMLEQNNNYVTTKGAHFFDTKSQGQAPKVTLVSCADSRVHTSIIDETPEGNLFIIKNIGNQVSTAQGSVKFGVNHLHTPLLVILGHSQCGAITAATHDRTGLEPSILKELDSLRLKSGESNIDGVIANVHNQVDIALNVFEKSIKNKELLVVGAVYDFSNDMKQGAGRLNILNVQGKHVEPSKFARE